MNGRAGDQGSVSVELALLTPALLLLLSFAVVAGRTQVAEGAVAEAARAAAREASLARDDVTAAALARAQADRTLAAQDLRCQSTIGTPATAAVRTNNASSRRSTSSARGVVVMAPLPRPGR